MKPIRFLFYLIMATVALIGCTAQQLAQGTNPTGTPTVVPSPTSLPTALSTLTPISSTPTAQPLPQAIMNVKEFLAKKLGIKAEYIRVVSFTAVDWPDSCLGINTPGIMCAMIVTPGYKVFLQIGDKVYELHSNRTGQVVRQVGDQLHSGNIPLIGWQSIAQPCQQATLTAQEAIYGDCQGGVQAKSPYVSPDREADFLHFTQTFASFTADTPSGKLTFSGQGASPASADQQRSIAEWARLALLETQSGRSDTAWSLALDFHRRGGIAGFSDNLAVYSAGYALVNTRNSEPAALKKIYLDAIQLKQLYHWLDTLKRIDYNRPAPANVSDGMSIALKLASTGNQAASDQDIQAILNFASSLVIENN